MNEDKRKELNQSIQSKVLRKIRAEKNGPGGIWRGLGLMGLIGWSIVLPTLLGAGFGFYLDKYFNSRFSWTLALLVVGLIFGCFNAWRWIRGEREAIEKEDADV